MPVPALRALQAAAGNLGELQVLEVEPAVVTQQQRAAGAQARVQLRECVGQRIGRQGLGCCKGVDTSSFGVRESGGPSPTRRLGWRGLFLSNATSKPAPGRPGRGGAGG